MHEFSSSIIAWQKLHGRHDLPWQKTRDPYRVWLSEIMLQQTQVGTVIPYYARFLERFPDIAHLADADEDVVLQHWSGLGYYSRARNLHRAAKAIAEQHQGQFPHHFEQIIALPGIGRSTAAAISAFAFGKRFAILDGNVKRVLARYFGVEGYPGEKKIENNLWKIAESILPSSDIEVYTQAVMDLGASICSRSRPECPVCPLQKSCVAFRDQRVAELPTRKQKKAIPTKQIGMLMMIHNDELFLEKRPSKGIWGGLWSFPEMAVGEVAEKFSHEQFKVSVQSTETLPILEHTFTHYKLLISPHLLHLGKLSNKGALPNGLWLSIDDAVDAAIPAPVRKLLLQIKGGGI
ncbi:A/G-specific adenine glycosylase [Sulfurirhabdus autotrophica]|nr:A/G-specific adenine glycosylase [Sulfurirhabdus autotrophica]